MRMPDDVRTEFAGNAQWMQKSLATQPLLIGAALIAMYIVLGVLYESLLHPLTIISTLPSAGIGALLAMLVTGTDLSVMGLIGIVLLMGIVKKNAIMLIDFALEAERQRGLTPFEAIHEACLERFRPIIMTTLAALFGALPLALCVRHRGGTAPAAGDRDRRRTDRVAGTDAVHDAGGVPGAGTFGRASQGDRALRGAGREGGVISTEEDTLNIKLIARRLPRASAADAAATAP